jgi:spore coat polysaccharide biosynthesis protein SpsF (cytidylyltransferase family)/methionyl-tRNA formyltransferase
MHKPKIVMVVQCRFRSKRLYGKAMLPLVKEMSVLEFLLKRMLLVKNIDQLVLTTGTHKSNDILKKIAKKLKISFFEGAEKNVIKRFCLVAKKTKADILVRVCGDNPLTDPYLITKQISYFLSKQDKIDHLSTFEKNTIPYGAGCAIFKVKTLMLAQQKTINNKCFQEHVEPFMLKSSKVITEYYKAEPELNYPKLRLSIDDIKDYHYVKSLTEYLFKKNKFRFKTKDIIKIVKKPKVALFANGEFGLSSLKLLKKMGVNIVCLITHPDKNAYKKNEIIKCSMLKKNCIIDYDKIKKNLKWFDKFEPVIALSCWSSYIFKSKLINYFPLGIYNFHNSLLPSLGGSGANIWAILKNANTGITMHKVSTQIDSGPIIYQKEIKTNYLFNGYTLLKKQFLEMLKALYLNWENILTNNHKYIKAKYKRSFFLKSERDKFKQIKLNKKYYFKEILNIIRAYQYGTKDSSFFYDKQSDNYWSVRLKISKKDIL